jgi:hypothetical protein
MPAYLEWTFRTALLAGVIAAVFALVSWTPIHTTVWGYVREGQWIWEHRSVPAIDPDMPLAEGMPAANDQWLTQLGLYFAHRFAGNRGLVAVHALVVTLIYGVVAFSTYRDTGRLWYGMLSLFVVGSLIWNQQGAFHPRLVGFMFFALLVRLLTRPRGGLLHYLGVGVVLAAWTNCHSSFVVGLMLLAVLALGELAGCWTRTGQLAAVWEDPLVRRRVFAFEIGAAASLANPVGFHLHRWVFGLTDNPIVRDLIELQRQPPYSIEAWAFYATVIGLVVLLRYSTRPVNGGEGLALATFGVAAVILPGAAVWWSIVLVFVAAWHMTSLVSAEDTAELDAAPRNFRFTGFALFFAAAMLALSGPVLGMHQTRRDGQPVPASQQLIAPDSPRGATAYLREHPPSGLVFCSQTWAPWLLWDGPPSIQVFATNRAILLPMQVWTDFRRIILFRRGFEFLLDRYYVNTLVIDLRTQADLLAWAKQMGWTIAYDDALCVVATRPQGAVIEEAGEAPPPPAAGDAHAGHDHAGHDHAGHDHAGHDHGDSKKKATPPPKATPQPKEVPEP